MTHLAWLGSVLPCASARLHLYRWKPPIMAKQVAATALALRGRLLLAAFSVVAALSHKQMLLFYSPAFFAYMLGLALRRPTWLGKVGRDSHVVRVVCRVS